ncbi:hypothetical protein [Phormidium sp. FACHB-1136]|uniref:hypothetical protein n=1 Tax=Phormidium sp. FACHB-1136 TaxID=2692848 RepID=UPI001684B5D3|nr:hypothetical protein [Phormidium sp. FACHB-1136]MBD2425247.1 hypothetical protein [Phormidium sp. FACHB-1136]
MTEDALEAMARRITKIELMVLGQQDRINDLAEVNRRRAVNISQLRRRVADLESEIGELQQKETL